MELPSFLIHFIYIGGTFAAGVATGYLAYEKLKKAFKTFRKQN